jgi:hypothetical protein
MHAFEPPPPPPKRRRAITLWAIAAAILIVPSLAVWIVRGLAFALSCVPGPNPCRNLPLGFVLHQALNLCWLIASDSLVGVAIGFVAGVSALIARRPLLASLSMLVLPLAALALPTMAVFFTLYPGCEPSETGIGDCVVWGDHMGMAFHRAAMAPNLIDNFVAYVFALAVMIAILGFAFFRPKRG